MAISEYMEPDLGSRMEFPQFHRFKQLSPHSQNSVLPPKESLFTFQNHLQKVSKENMPVPHQQALSDMTHSSSSASMGSSEPSIKRRRLQPYILVPTVSHPATPIKNHTFPSRIKQSGAKPRAHSKGPNGVAAALFQQFSHNTAPNEASKKPSAPAAPAAQQVSMPVSPSSVPQKRSFSVVSQASSPDVLLLAPELEVPTVTASTRIASDKSGTPSGPASAANSASPEQPEPLQDVDQRRSKEPDQHAEYHSKERGLDAVSHASDLQTDVAVQRADRNEWSGPPLHAYVREPPTSAERAKSSATRYNPTPGWQSLSRVPDRLPFLTRSETPAQRYTEILEQLYGPGDVRRGNGRRPGKVHSEVGRPVVSSDVESDDENEEIAAGEEENLRSDDSSSAPPVTPPDPALFSSSSATLLHAPAIVDSPEQPPHMEREIEIGPVPTETVDTSEHPSPLGIDGDLLALTSSVPAFDSSKTTSVRDVVIRRSALGMPVDGFLPEADSLYGPEWDPSTKLNGTT
ncbi:hypothetical protein DFH11DRAFT_1554972 [Phellopilus nigrolimitatus]|nr:hypothetical protein DFH11DRAFT_1554972 [Phellopilus nigrolimitatus]